MPIISFIREGIQDTSQLEKKLQSRLPKSTLDHNANSLSPSEWTRNALQLHLHGNELTNFFLSPKGQLSSWLVHLDLSSNTLKGHLSTVFDEQQAQQNFPHLLILNLSNNQIDALDVGFDECFPRLKSLSIAWNRIASLSALAPCDQLRSLDVRGNLLKEASDFAVLASCRSLKALRILSSDTGEGLKDSKRENPIGKFKTPDWRSAVWNMLRQLQFLDSRDRTGRFLLPSDSNYNPESISIYKLMKEEFGSFRNPPPNRSSVKKEEVQEKAQSEPSEFEVREVKEKEDQVGAKDRQEMMQLLGQIGEAIKTIGEKDRPRTPQQQPPQAQVHENSGNSFLELFKLERQAMNDRIMALEHQLSTFLESSHSKEGSILSEGPENDDGEKENCRPPEQNAVKLLEDARQKYMEREASLVEQLKRSTLELGNWKIRCQDIEKSREEINAKYLDDKVKYESVLRQLAERNEQVKELKTFLESLQKEHTKLEDILLKSTSEMNKEERKLTELSVTLSFKEKQLAEREKTIDSLKEENKNLQNEMNSLKNQLALANEKVKDEIVLKSKLETRVAELESESSASRNNCQQHLNTLRDLEERLKRESEEARRKILQLEESSFLRVGELMTNLQCQLNKQFESQLAVKDDEIRTLKALESESVALKSKVNSLTELLDDSNKQREQLKAKDEKIQDLEGLIKDMTRIVKDQKLEITNLKHGGSEKIAAMEKTIESKEHELSLQKSDFEVKVAKLESEKKALEQELARHDAEIREQANIKRKVSHLESKLSEIDSDYQEQLTSLEAKLKKTEDALKIKVKMLDDQNDTIEKLKERIHDLRADLEQRQDDESSQIRQLEGQIYDQSRENEQMRRDLERTQRDLFSAESQVSDLKKNCQELGIQASKLQRQILEKDNQISQIEKEFKKVCLGFKERQSELELELKDKEQTLAEVKKISENYSSQIEQLERQLTLLKGQVSVLEKERIDHQKEIEAKESYSRELRETLSQYQKWMNQNPFVNTK